jgi:hypothetical protein
MVGKSLKKYTYIAHILLILCMAFIGFSACKAKLAQPDEIAKNGQPAEVLVSTQQMTGTNPGFSMDIPSTWIVEDLSSVPGYGSDYVRGYYYMHTPISFPFISDLQLIQLTMKILYEEEMPLFDKQIYSEYIVDTLRKNMGVLDVLQEKINNSTVVKELETEEINGIQYYTIILKQTASHHVDTAYHVIYVTYHEEYAFVLWLQTIDSESDLSWLKHTLGSLNFSDTE